MSQDQGHELRSATLFLYILFSQILSASNHFSLLHRCATEPAAKSEVQTGNASVAGALFKVEGATEHLAGRFLMSL
ncbi:hypothetical protein BJX70DRAFT_382180 [Aspergillus crustosus]